MQIPITIYRDKALNTSDEIVIIKHIYNLILSNKIDENFKYSFTSLARSYIFEYKDNEILNYIKQKNYQDTEIMQKINLLKQNINQKTNEILIREIIDNFDIYQKMIKIGDIKNRITIIDSLIKVAQNCDKLGYKISDFYEYLNEVLEEGLNITLALNKENSNSVKIMTIHASKGLEFPVCYFSSLNKKFNIDDLKNLFYFEEKYGLILPYYNNGPKSTILKTLLKHSYLKEEISEKIRLFYVALTRAREKIILVTNLEEKPVFKDNGSFIDILNSVYKTLEKYITNIDLSTLKLTKEYNLSKKSMLKLEFSTAKVLNIEELNIQNIELGLKMHNILENVDFKNPDLSALTPFEKNKITSFINTGILNNAKQIYKEYEFIYEENNEEYHGIIDLLLIKENENIIIDYKLKNITDDAYLQQLNGYKKYIQNITNKNTKIYLYSILDEKLVDLN